LKTKSRARLGQRAKEGLMKWQEKQALVKEYIELPWGSWYE
jgi:hypothetical protein